jgi:hypothetical protein
MGLLRISPVPMYYTENEKVEILRMLILRLALLILCTGLETSLLAASGLALHRIVKFSKVSRQLKICRRFLAAA